MKGLQMLGLVLSVLSLGGCPFQQSTNPELPAPPDIEQQAPIATGFAPGVYAGDITETFTVYALGDVVNTMTVVRLYTIQVLGNGTVTDVRTGFELGIGVIDRQSGPGFELWQIVTNVVVSDTSAAAALQMAYRDDNALYQGTGQQVLEQSGSDIEFSGSFTLAGRTTDGRAVTQIIDRSGTLRP